MRIDKERKVMSEKEIRVDYNKVFRKEMEMSRDGELTKAESYKMKMDELNRIKESGVDYCSCPEACPHHGKCWECVMLHRGHRDHLPYCMWDMVNERIYDLQLITEGSLKDYKRHGSPCEGCSQKEWEESIK